MAGGRTFLRVCAITLVLVACYGVSYAADPASPVDSVRQAVDDLDAWLGSSPHAAGWRRLLETDELRTQIELGDNADPKIVGRINERFSSGLAGLELPKFARLRKVLDGWGPTLQQRSPEEVPRLLTEAQLDPIAKAVTEYLSNATNERGRPIARELAALPSDGKAGEAARIVRQSFSRPNLYVEIEAPIVTAGFDDVVNEVTPVHEVILGTKLHGNARLVGQVRGELSPDPRRAVIASVLSATAYSNTIGYNGPVTIYSTGQTAIHAQQRIAFDAGGLWFWPATASATTDSTIHDIQANRGGLLGCVIEKAAWRRAGQQQGASEKVAARRAEARVRGRVQGQAMERLSKANGRYQKNFREALLKRNAFPKLLRFATTPQELTVVGLQARDVDFAAPTAPPPIEGNPGLALRMHDSLIDNHFNATLAGETITQEGMEARFKEIGDGTVPEKLRPKPDEPPWTMTFAEVDPLTVSFADGAIRITLRGTQYTRGERTFKGMNITALYKIMRDGERVRLVRDGDLVIVPPGRQPGEQLSTQEVTLRRLLRNRFDTLFEPEIGGQGLELPRKWKKLGKLPVTQFTSEKGWLTAAWRLP
jgi:hypothetical protein